MVRLAALVCALAGCDALFGLNAVPDPTDSGSGSGSGSSSPYAYVQFYENHGAYGQTTVTVPFQVAPMQGSLIVVAIGTYWNTPAMVTDTAGNTYAEVLANPRSGGGSEVSLYYASHIATSPTFAITVATAIDSVHPGQIEVTAVAHEYTGPFQGDPLDLDQEMIGSTLGPNGQVDADCGMASPNTPSVMVAALTRDFNGDVIGTPSWRLRKSVDLDHTMYAVLATEDRVAGPELADPVFSAVHDADGTTWACLWATFH